MQPVMPIRVHHLNNSRSQRVLWLLEELQVPYEVMRYERNRRTLLAPPALKEVYPLGKSPILEDAGRKFAETGLIVDYLVDRYGPQLAPARATEPYWRYRYWLHYAEGSVAPALLLKLVIDKLGLLGWPARGFVRSQLELHLSFLEGELARSEWFSGAEFTAADIVMSFPLEISVTRAGLNSTRPRLWAFLKRIHARPAYARALERGGAYAYAGGDH
jgi:glutathione S-transferase